MSLAWKSDPLGVMGGLAPIPGSRGVFLTSDGAAVSSAMIVRGGTVGTGFPGDRMDVFSRGRTRGCEISAGGRAYISGGGTLIQNVTSGRSLLYYLSNISRAHAAGNHVMMYGCGIGPVQYPGDRRRPRDGTGP